MVQFDEKYSKGAKTYRDVFPLSVVIGFPTFQFISSPTLSGGEIMVVVRFFTEKEKKIPNFRKMILFLDTVRKLQNFSVTQILREIKVRKFRGAKSVIFTHLQTCTG